MSIEQDIYAELQQLLSEYRQTLSVDTSGLLTLDRAGAGDAALTRWHEAGQSRYRAGLAPGSDDWRLQRSTDGGEGYQDVLTVDHATGQVAILDLALDRLSIQTVDQGVYVNSHNNEYGRPRVAGFRRNWNGFTSVGIYNGNVGAAVGVEVNKITGTAYSAVSWQLLDNNGSPYDLYSYGSAVNFVRMTWQDAGVLVDFEKHKAKFYKSLESVGPQIWAKGQGNAGKLMAGEHGVRSGFLELYGGPAGQAEGGEINLFFAPDYAVGASNRAVIDVYQDYLRIFAPLGGGGNIFVQPFGSRMGIGKIPTEKLDVSGAVNATAYKLSGQPLPVTNGYEVAEQIITSGSVITLPHGRAGRPKALELGLICKTAEHGYAVDAVYPLAMAGGVGVAYDATDLKVVVDPAGVTIRHATTAADVTLTNSNWRIIGWALA